MEQILQHQCGFTAGKNEICWVTTMTNEMLDKDHLLFKNKSNT